MPTQTLNSGKKIPLIGLGTWKSKAGEIKQATLHALRAGYRHIDCAEYYANEHEIGQALQIVFAEGVVKREDVFLTSKLWNNHHGRESVKPAVQKILKDLKVNHLDLLLIHWPVTGNVGSTVQPSIRETWQAMEDLVSEGLVHSIGVSNFSTKKARRRSSLKRINTRGSARMDANRKHAGSSCWPLFVHKSALTSRQTCLTN